VVRRTRAVGKARLPAEHAITESGETLSPTIGGDGRLRWVGSAPIPSRGLLPAVAPGRKPKVHALRRAHTEYQWAAARRLGT
jgi:hypothetical protein